MQTVIQTDFFKDLTTLTGVHTLLLVETHGGEVLESWGDISTDLEIAAWGNAQVLHAKKTLIKLLKLNDYIEDILISYPDQYHLIRPLESNPELFIYVVIERAVAQLAMIRYELQCFERELNFFAY